MRLRSLLRDQIGGIAILWAILLPVIVGFIGLGLGISYCYLVRSQLRAATDSAAVTATIAPELAPKAINAVTVLAMKLNGFEPDHVTLTINHPPLQGAYAGSVDAVEIIAIAPLDPIFRFFTPIPAVSSRAVGISGRLVE